MGWRYGRWRAEHPLPVASSERAGVGRRVRAGDVLAAGTTLGSVVRVRAARRLGVSPEDLTHVMRVEIGAEVERGQVVARTGKRFARAASSPIAGRVVHRTAEGDLCIAPVVGRWAVRSTLDGAVVRADDACVTVEGEAWCVEGVAGYGPDAVGEIALAVDDPGDELAPGRIDARLRDRILVGGARTTAEAITRAHACGVAGLVAGAVPAGGLRVVYGDDVGASGALGGSDAPTVLCLLGFGAAALPYELFAPLAAFSGERAALHTGSARLFVFAARDATETPTHGCALALAGDWGAVRAIETGLSLAGPARFPSEIETEAVAGPDGPIPLANVIALGAARSPRT